MARIPDGWVFIPKIKNSKMTEVEIEVEEKDLVFCEHCMYSEQKPWQYSITPDYYCHRGKEPELVLSDHFCGYGEKGKE